MVNVVDDDIDKLLFAGVNSEISEGGTMSYEVKLATMPSGTVVVKVAAEPSTGLTISPESLTFEDHEGGELEGWNVAQTVTVRSTQDKIAEDDVSVSIKHTAEDNSNNRYNNPDGEDQIISLTVKDNDTAGFEITKDEVTVDEGNNVELQIRPTSDPNGNVTVDCLTSDSDIATTNSPAVFNSDNWDDRDQSIRIDGTDDGIENVDGERSAQITCSSASYADDVLIQVTVSDTDDVTEIDVSRTSLSVREEDGKVPETFGETAQFTVTSAQDVKVISESTTVQVCKGVRPSDDRNPNEAEEAWDDRVEALYKAWCGEEQIFSDNEDVNSGAAVIVIAVNDDKDNNGPVIIKATIGENLGKSISVSVGDQDTAGLEITTDDEETISEGESVEYEVKLDSDPVFPTGVAQVTVTVVSDSSAARVDTDPTTADIYENTLTFEGGACDPNSDSDKWCRSKSVTVTGMNDDAVSGSRTVTITFTPDGGDYSYKLAENKTIRVTDGDSAALVADPELLSIQEGTEGTYEVSLDVKPTGTVRVAVASSNRGVATVTPSMLTFPADSRWSAEQTVIVTGIDDAKYSTGARTARITHTARGGGYERQSVSVAVTVTENTSPGIVVSPLEVEVGENKTATYKVGLSTLPTGTDTVTVDVASSNTGVAIVDTDAGTPGNQSTLTFTTTGTKIWNKPQTVTVTGVNDLVVGDRIATITHRASRGDYAGKSASVAVTVKDNDATATVSSPAAGVTVTEASGAGRTASYTLKLDGEPTGEVKVTVASSDSSAATVSPSTLTFTPSGTEIWSKPQTITVTGVDNQGDDGASRSVTITHTFGGGGFAGVSVSVNVTVTDDDGLVVVPKTAAEVDEAAGTYTYTVKLSSQPAGNVTVAVTKSGDSEAATVSPSTLTFTTSNWSTAQTVTVTGVPDDVDNAGDQRVVTLTHTPSGLGANAGTESVQVTVTDDDAAPAGITLSVDPSEVDENAGATVVTVTATVNGETRYGVSRSVTVAVGASGDSATEGTDYQTVAGVRVTIPAGAASSKTTFTLTPKDDTEFERPETITVAGTLSGVTVTPASITLIDDDTPPTLSIDSPAVQEGAADTTTPLRFTVTLNKATAQVVTVKYAGAADGTAEAGADYEALTEGALTFAANETKKTITVTVKGDDMDEDDETLKVMLSSPTIATIAVGMGTGTIRDDDEPPELSIKGATVAEGHAGTTTPLVFTVTKDGATSKEVTVDYKVSGGTAKRGEDYTAPATGTLTFTSDQATRRITITVKGDNVQEDDETIEIALQQAPKNATLAAGKSKATGTITDDDVLQTVAKDWMARFGRTAAAATVDAIAIRMNDAATSAGEDHSLTLAGQRLALVGAAPLPLQAAARIEPWEEGATGSITLQDLAEDSAFDLGRSLAEGYLSVWAASSYHQFEKTSEYTLDGNLVSAILGADHAGDHHVAGMALAYHGGGGEYGDLGEDDEGELAAALYSFHPYVRLTIGDYLHIGGSFGAGTGSMNIKPAGGKEVETSMTMTALGALDARLDLNLSPGWLLAVQADAHTVHMVSAEKKPELPELATATNRIRLGLESSYAFLVGEGMSLAPTVEAGVRHDGGDAETGLGLDAGGGLRFTAAAIGLMVDARGHVVLSNFASDAQTGDAAGALREWGLGGMIRWRPDFGGHGPEVTLAPSYGAAAGGLNPGAIPSLDAEVGYRLPAFGGVLTPYSSAEFAGSGQRSYRAGAHLEFGHAVEVSAEGTYQQSATGDAEQFLTLRARLRQ